MRLTVPKSELLSRYTDLELWKLALGYEPQIGQKCNSPFRKDSVPSGCFYKGKNDSIWFTDFGTGENIGARKGFEILNGDASKLEMKSKPKTSTKTYKKKKITIEIEKGYWTQERLQYWKDFHVDEDLLREEVSVCKKVTLKTDYDSYALLEEYHSYAYYFSNTDHYKIYQPFSHAKKFVGNTTTYDIYGMSTIEGYDDVIITSSGKDYLVLKSLRDELDMEFDVIAPNAEGYLIPENSRKKIQDRNIYLYYDNDQAGIKNAEKHASVYDAKIIVNPEDKPKDPSDWSKANRQEFIDFFTQQL